MMHRQIRLRAKPLLAASSARCVAVRVRQSLTYLGLPRNEVGSFWLIIVYWDHSLSCRDMPLKAAPQAECPL